MKERVLITGVSGCIGQATVAWLRERGVPDIVGMTRSGVAEDLDCVKADIGDAAAVAEAVARVNPTRIIHLAAWQTPDCQAHPLEGMKVNLSGTENVLRAAAPLGERLQRFVFASSAAVYGSRDLYVGGLVRENDPCRPPHLYGFWKIAGEGMTLAFKMETDVPAISLRVATTYGPGRDRGLTAAPTTAMKAMVLGEPFEVSYDGREHFHYVADVGAAFGMCAMERYAGYGVFNARGITVRTRDFVEAVKRIGGEMGLPGVEGVKVANDPDAFPFVCDLADDEICNAFEEMPLTGLNEGIRKALEYFVGEKEAGRLVLG